MSLGLSSPRLGVFVPAGVPCGEGTLRTSRVLTKGHDGRTLNPVTGTSSPPPSHCEVEVVVAVVVYHVIGTLFALWCFLKVLRLGR